MVLRVWTMVEANLRSSSRSRMSAIEWKMFSAFSRRHSCLESGRSEGYATPWASPWTPLWSPHPEDTCFSWGRCGDRGGHRALFTVGLAPRLPKPLTRAQRLRSPRLFVPDSAPGRRFSQRSRPWPSPPHTRRSVLPRFYSSYSCWSPGPVPTAPHKSPWARNWLVRFSLQPRLEVPAGAGSGGACGTSEPMTPRVSSLLAQGSEVT